MINYDMVHVNTIIFMIKKKTLGRHTNKNMRLCEFKAM